MRSHFGFVLNAGDPHPCTTGYVPIGQHPEPGGGGLPEHRRRGCRVINGVDPNPGDGYDENGSNIRASRTSAGRRARHHHSGGGGDRAQPGVPHNARRSRGRTAERDEARRLTAAGPPGRIDERLGGQLA